MGYYEEIIGEIKAALLEKDYRNARFLLERELRMPYIPEDTEKQLHSLMKDLDYAESENRKPSGQPDVDEMWQMLEGDASQQLLGASLLSDVNLRPYAEKLQKAFDSTLSAEAQALLIEAIAEQEIDASFTVNKDGLAYEFDGDAVTPVMKAEGFREAFSLLKAWTAQNPGLWNMARELLIHAGYLYLPLSFEKEEGEGLAEEVLQQACRMLGDEKLADTILVQWHEHRKTMS
ncbi:MAG: DUF3196 domain-containing protein [Bulleidia sp.]|nr:DUF3196 domain-containing protein [Bulleidia sp.]